MDKRILFLLNRAQHRLKKRVNRELSEAAGITLAQGGALAFLIKNNGCLLKEISAGLGLNNSAITGLVKRMEKAGLIEKCMCDSDGRAFRVYITEKGIDASAKSLSLLKKFNDIISREFKEPELEIIARFLNFLANIEE